MKKTICASLFVVLLAPTEAAAQAKAAGLGTEEFGLSPRELVQAVEKSEELIARCMREQGFEYYAVDYNTVREGMAADKRLPGLSEEEFIAASRLRHINSLHRTAAPAVDRLQPCPHRARRAQRAGFPQALFRRSGCLQSCAIG